MADADKNLQERLNALKPAGAISPGPSISYTSADTIERTKPPTRDDNLSNRLKTLREQAESPKSPSSQNENRVPTKQEGATTPPPPYEPASNSNPLDTKDVTPAQQKQSVTLDYDQDIDPLLQTDDQTLEELLADLESDQPWLDEVAAEQEEHQRVMALLNEIGKAGDTQHHATGRASKELSGEEESSSESEEEGHDQDQKEDKNGDDNDNHDDDNSDGEKMTDEVDKVLAKAMDQVDLDKSSNEDPFNNLPTVPQNDDGGGGSSLATTNTRRQGKEEEDDESLFAARFAALKAQPPNTQNGDDDDDDDLLPSAPTSEPQTSKNDFGLPGAPTFAPGQRPTHTTLGSAKFTDEDQRSWCTVCLEDGAIRCLDCEDPRATAETRGKGEVYCARCWKEMHVGPMAGFEERGHRWEKFVRPRIK